MTEALGGVPGVVGVVLGGSRARGAASPDSDYDFGVYYSEGGPLDVAALDAAAALLDDAGRTGLVAPPGAWGNWVNGGAWLTVDGLHVDLILRDVARVAAEIAACLAGKVHAHYQTGHPHAYLNAMYMGELAIAQILHDPSGRVRDLQRRTVPYPDELRRALVEFFGFEAGFSHMLAAASVARGDAYYVAAHIVRSLSCLNQALFAANREYCINEKKAVAMIDGFARKPPDYGRRVAGVVALAGVDDAAACAGLERLLRDARAFFSP